MEPVAWEVVSGLDGKDQAGFFVMVGCVALVVVGIPTLIGGWGNDRSSKFNAILTFMHGCVLVFGPVVLLAPMFIHSSKLTIVAALIYVSMLLVRFFMGFPKRLRDVAVLVLGPWVLGAASGLLGGLIDGRVMFGSVLIDVGLQVALVAYVSFWVGFPIFFFARSSPGEQWRTFTTNPLLYLVGLAFIFCIEAVGLVTCYFAWLGSLPVYGQTGWATIVTLVAVVLQVACDVRPQFRLYSGSDPDSVIASAQPDVISGSVKTDAASGESDVMASTNCAVRPKGKFRMKSRN